MCKISMEIMYHNVIIIRIVGTMMVLVLLLISKHTVMTIGTELHKYSLTVGQTQRIGRILQLYRYLQYLEHPANVQTKYFRETDHTEFPRHCAGRYVSPIGESNFFSHDS